MSPAELRIQALAQLGDALGKSPAELNAEVDDAERTISALRDALIDRLRAGAEPSVRPALDRVNTALTLVVGLEYPMGGLQRKLLEDARGALNEVVLPDGSSTPRVELD